MDTLDISGLGGKNDINRNNYFCTTKSTFAGRFVVYFDERIE